MMKYLFTKLLIIFPLLGFSQKAELKGVFQDTLLYARPVTISLLTNGNLISETVANKEGNYSFKNLEPGIYTLRFKRIGERDVVKDSINLKKGEIVELNVNSMECPFSYPKDYKAYCPKNRADKVIPIVYGLPTAKTMQKAKEGKLYLGGCVITYCNPHYYCPNHKLEF